MSAALGLYVHWPYCTKICPYCDFNVRPEKGQNTDFLVDAICADIRGWHQRLDTPKPLTSLSFGGGTPSRLLPAQMQQILSQAEQSFGFEADIELSVEANPADMNMGRAADFAQIGINRLSLGIQSLDDQELTFLGRDHTTKQALFALDIAHKNFPQVSADFIYGLPEQKLDTWDKQLTEILKLGTGHLSLYCLSIEPKTVFFQRQKTNQLFPLCDDDMADLFELTRAKTNAIGLNAYETSNHAKTKSTRSRHNLLYWQGDDWIGVGPGAHGRANIDGQRTAISTILRPADYAKTVQKTGWGAKTAEALLPKDDLAERLMLGLRLSDGINLEQLQTRAKTNLDPGHLKEALQNQTLRLEKAKLIATAPLLVDRIALDLLASS